MDYTLQSGDDRVVFQADPARLAALIARGYGVDDDISLARLDDDLWVLDVATDLYHLELHLDTEDLDALANAQPT